MRKVIVPFAAILAFVSLGAAPAIAQAAPAPSETAAKDAAPPEQAALSEEDKTATPFPPGQNAALVKKVCTVCHSAKPILDLQYDKEEAANFYKNMVESDTTTDQAQKIIEYLSTVLGH